MLASYGLFAVATAAHWSIGSLAIRGDDVYAVVGLIAAIIVLSLWVVIENLRRARWNPEKISDSRARQHTATPESPETHAKAQPDMTPVAARAEWLLDDNTLVRTRLCGVGRCAHRFRRSQPLPRQQPRVVKKCVEPHSETTKQRSTPTNTHGIRIRGHNGIHKAPHLRRVVRAVAQRSQLTRRAV